MGLFDFLKKKSVHIELEIHKPTQEQQKIQWAEHTEEKVRNFQKNEAGLYPYEILMLSYIEQYANGKAPARFWEREYGVSNVFSLIQSLEDRGFAKNGKLTELGKREIKNNEYVLYMHRHKFPDISMATMSILVNKHPEINYRDLIWGELNRLSLEYVKNNRFGWYRNVKYAMYQFLLEEKRHYSQAFLLLSEVFFYDLNGSSHPFIPPALIEDFRKIEQKLDYTDEQIIEILQEHFYDMYAPYKNYSTDELTCIIAAYCLGHDEIAEKVFHRNHR